ncbi:uncharacterized protein LOC113870129 [Abrus precatorius]|uniref:Uncharacterized protein LOC113870129 n=1 Tax=Abrus precatorius TaxID=3816 RepID=A0A8B8M1J7_ABRPR|nr:uncharacterized protein LOC113870129 [Abrus precatorius]
MAAIVCHGLQSYLESQLVESRIHSHRLRLPSPKPLTPPQPQAPIDLAFKSCFWEPDTKPHREGGCGWTSIEALSNVSQCAKESSYVLPQSYSSVRLSPQSLELCTENLGNETGSDMIESGIDLLSSSEGENLVRREEKRKTRQVLGAKEFPPPLTTIRGSESLRVRSHREDGRLVLELTKVNVPSCFQAQRSHGRLRLRFWTHPQDHDHDDVDVDIQEQFENGQTQDVEEYDDDDEEDEEEDVVDTENEGGWEETKGHNSWRSIEGGVRMEKYEIERRSRMSQDGGSSRESTPASQIERFAQRFERMFERQNEAVKNVQKALANNVRKRSHNHSPHAYGDSSSSSRERRRDRRDNEEMRYDRWRDNRERKNQRRRRDDVRHRAIKYFKCLKKGHIAFQCPNKKTTILKKNGEILSAISSQSSHASSEEDSEFEALCHEGDLLMVRRLLGSIVKEDDTTQRKYFSFKMLGNKESNLRINSLEEGGIDENQGRSIEDKDLKALEGLQ